MEDTCKYPGCETEAAKAARGLCWKHYRNRDARAQYANPTKQSKKKRSSAAPAKKKPASATRKKTDDSIGSIDELMAAIKGQIEAAIKIEVKRGVCKAISTLKDTLAV